ncbi:MAG: hypothetical protein GY757_47625 [bacterium]|nr:hypothetical protein [bacterium]
MNKSMYPIRPALLLFFIASFLLNSFLNSSSPTIQQLKKQVVTLGKLDFKTDVPVRYLNRNSLKKYLTAFMEKEYPDEMALKESLYLYLMGFSDKRINVKRIRKTILLANIGGMYNEKTKELLAVEQYRTIDIMNSMIIIHELRHAIQDSHFNLTGILGSYSDYDDRKLAVLSAVEGDATFLMTKYNNFSAEVMTASMDADALLSFTPMGNTAALYKTPNIVKYQLSMPYIQGLRFVNAVFKKKRKWKGVNKILKSPPESSEQILHPEKYFKKEKPLPVSVLYKPEGMSLYHSGVIGEYFLNILLKPENEYIDFAIGWGGDSFHLYKNETSYFLIWKSAWDKEKFCSNFYFDFMRFIKKKFTVNLNKGNVNGRPFIAGKCDSGYFFIERIKDRMTYVRTSSKEQMNKFIYGGNYD